MKKITQKFPGVLLLIVEDNEINMEVTRDILELMECHVDGAMDGQRGVQMALEKEYDMILMDIQMPGMDGFAASREIRRQLQMKKQPIIIALTASSLDGDKERFLEAGMEGCLIKPIEAADLEEVLLKYFPERAQAFVPH